ncbi:MAG: hypothetical protein E7364_01940 [Clostridiales bacterium]|nr:hypothetical protein [Clostridiales bacterium]
MIGVKKRPLGKVGRKEIIKFDSFILSDEEKAGSMRAKSSQNCDCTDGKISHGIALKPYKTASGTELYIGAVSDVRMLFPLYASDALGNSVEDIFVLYQLDGKGYGRRYLNENSAWNTPSEYLLETAGVYALKPDGGVVSLLFNKSGCKYRNMEGFYISRGYRKSRGMACYCQNRVFVASGDREITYSDPAEPTEITKAENDGGAILRPLDGDVIVELLAKEDCVYVFYRHSIVKIEVTGEPKGFRVRPLGYTGGEIYGKTAVVCGAWIVFLAADGIYRFDGEKAERICKWMQVKVSTENPTFGRGRYLSNALISYTDEQGNLCTVAIEPEKKDGYFLAPLKGLTECNGRTFCVLMNKIMQVDEENRTSISVSCSFTSTEMDFGDKEKKTLKSVRLKGEGSVLLRVYCDTKTIGKELTFVNGEASFSPMLRGKKFSFGFTLGKNSCVEGLEAEVSFWAVK